MKYIFLTFILIIISSFTSGSFQKQPDTMHLMAMSKTDKQLDSIFTSISPITFKDLNDGFEGLMSHMDSINEATLILVNQRDSAAKSRDDAILLAIQFQKRNLELRKENTEYSDTLDVARLAPHILMMFVVTLSAFLVGSGFLNWCKERRRIKKTENHVG